MKGPTKTVSSQNIRSAKAGAKPNAQQPPQNNHNNQQNNHQNQQNQPQRIKLTQSAIIPKSPEIKENDDSLTEDSRARLTSSEPINKDHAKVQNYNDNIIENKTDKIDKMVLSDVLEVSRYPIVNPVDVTITKMQEIKLQQKLLKELKFVSSLDERVLKEQHFYWLFTNNIVNEDARARIKSSLELYCVMPMHWVSGTELEIDINPEHRIEKASNYKKKV